LFFSLVLLLIIALLRQPRTVARGRLYAKSAMQISSTSYSCHLAARSMRDHLLTDPTRKLHDRSGSVSTGVY